MNPVNVVVAPSRALVLRRFGTRVGALAVLATTLFTTGACATKRDLRDLRAEMRAQTARQDTTLVEIQRLIGELERSVNDQTQADFDARAELMRQLLNLEEQMIQVQELSGQNQRTLAQLRDQVESRRDQLSQPVRGPGQVADDPDQEQADFDAAMEVYNRGSMAAARRGFESFLTRYPTHDLAPDAHYFYADVLQQLEGPDAALVELLKIPEQFPTAARVPEALYRAGAIELGRGDADAARLYFNRVVNTYPDSDSATLARQRLAEIG